MEMIAHSAELRESALIALSQLGDQGNNRLALVIIRCMIIGIEQFKTSFFRLHQGFLGG